MFKVTQSCQKAIRKACRRNPQLRKALESKMAEVIANPHRFKHLQHTDEWRVHVLGFVLVYTVKGHVVFLRFRRHDDAYER